ncbi:MAG: energy transducer TonB [Ferruginibacter sp.]
MQKELILNSDILDILFENKNKAYGAYSLRKFYNNRLYKSIGIMGVVVAVLAAFSFIPKKEAAPLISKVIDVPLFQGPKEKEKKKEEIHESAKTSPQQKMSPSFKIVPNNTVVDTIATLKNDLPIGLTDVKPDSTNTGGGGILTGTGGGKGLDTVATVMVPTPFNPDEVRDNPDVMPSYPGGTEGLIKFLKKNLTNPKEMEEGESVKVVVKFVVGYDGKLKSFDIVQDGGEDFNKEVIRVLKKMPSWNPGKSNGRDVSAYCSIPIRFVPAD